MGKNLIIVESPAKVKTIKKFLGRDYQVEASVGHVRDLPAKELGVDEDNGFTPKYQIIQGKKKVVDKLRQAAKKAEKVYLAPDPDREGEAIAWHVAELLKTRDHEPAIERIQFNEITPRAVREALAHPRQLDEKLFNSQQARRILDRLVGYKLSPLLWDKIKRGISAGRVQSVALRIVVEREKERQAFDPVEYWVFKVDLEGDQPPPFSADLWKIEGKKAEVGSEDAALALEKDLAGKPFMVESVVEKERKRSSPPPFITSTLQQDASRALGYSAKKTMSTAQRLYEGVELGDRGTTALITYMRTDSVRVSQDARDQAKDFIVRKIGEDFYPEKARHFKTKAGAQDAHEAIRPVDVFLTPEEVKPYLPRDQYSLYRLIWRRFVASQMAPARFWDTTVVFACGRTQWRAKGERLLFPGYLKVYGREEGDPGLAKELPKLEEGQQVKLLEMHKEQKFTQPPPRYTEASLVKELEDKGIGRPSTYAQIISTIIDRDYVRLEDKKLAPSELGVTVSDLLAAHFETIMDIGFTAEMEERLDAVAEGSIDWIDLLTGFTGEFYPSLAKAGENMERVRGQGKDTGITCELCGEPMVIRFGKRGEFLGCSGYPDCKNIKNFTRDEKGEIEIVEREEVEPVKVGECPDCSKDLVIKQARTGSRFIACTGWPDCKHAEPFTTGVKCPKCEEGELVERSSRRGKIFYSCNTYPKCDYATWDWPIAEPCPMCNSPITVRKTTKAKGEHIACPTKGCRYTQEIESGEDESESAAAAEKG
jgi:DNA topoisomerase-1